MDVHTWIHYIQCDVCDVPCACGSVWKLSFLNSAQIFASQYHYLVSRVSNSTTKRIRNHSNMEMFFLIFFWIYYCLLHFIHINMICIQIFLWPDFPSSFLIIRNGNCIIFIYMWPFQPILARCAYINDTPLSVCMFWCETAGDVMLNS